MGRRSRRPDGPNQRQSREPSRRRGSQRQDAPLRFPRRARTSSWKTESSTWTSSSSCA